MGRTLFYMIRKIITNFLSLKHDLFVIKDDTSFALFPNCHFFERKKKKKKLGKFTRFKRTKSFIFD
jgi:hypothetical protein